jgi:hypothetical protein
VTNHTDVFQDVNVHFNTAVETSGIRNYTIIAHPLMYSSDLDHSSAHILPKKGLQRNKVIRFAETEKQAVYSLALPVNNSIYLASI